MTVPASPALTLSVRVQPRAKRNAVVGRFGDAVKVCVTAPPEDGRANDAVTEVLADWLGIRVRQIEIIAGVASRNKIVRINGLSRVDLERRLKDL